MNNTQGHQGMKSVRTIVQLFLCVVLIAPLNLFAYDIETVRTTSSNNFVVAPAKIELSLAPGELATVDIFVENQTGIEQRFAIGVEDVTGSDDPKEAIVLLGDDRGPYSLRDYIEVSEREFVLPASSRARVPVTVAVPSDATPGGYFGTVLFAVSGTSSETGAAIVSRIGALFFVTVEGAVRAEGSLESFQVANTDTDEPLSFQVLFRNSGNVYLNPSGYITIENMFGRTVETITLDPWYVLPESVRLREATLSRENLFGRYSATLSLNPGYEGEITTETISFFVVPVGGALFGYLAALFVLLAIAVMFIRSRMRRSLS